MGQEFPHQNGEGFTQEELREFTEAGLNRKRTLELGYDLGNVPKSYAHWRFCQQQEGARASADRGAPAPQVSDCVFYICQ